MEINSQLLFKFIGKITLNKAGFDKLTFCEVVYRVRRYYCRPLTIARKCPRNCQNCNGILNRVVGSIDKEIANDPYAFLVIGLRRAVSDWVEPTHEATIRVKDNFGTRDESNIFDVMLAEMGS